MKIFNFQRVEILFPSGMFAEQYLCLIKKDVGASDLHTSISCLFKDRNELLISHPLYFFFLTFLMWSKNNEVWDVRFSMWIYLETGLGVALG